MKSKAIKVTCADCGKTIVMSELDYELRYRGVDKSGITCHECNKTRLKKYFKENPDVKKAFMESLYEVMGTEEKREKLANEICDGWNNFISNINNRR